jgi:ATP-dependent DNA helicase RecG
MSNSPLHNEITYLKGVGPKRAEVLQKDLAIYSFKDLAYYYPYRYLDRSKFHKIKDLQQEENSHVQIKGEITSIQSIGNMRNSRLSVSLQDESGKLELVWFKGVKWIKEKLQIGKRYVVYGKVNIFNNRINIPHPEIQLEEEFENEVMANNIQPMYSSTEKAKARGLDTKGIQKLTKGLLAEYAMYIEESLSDEIIQKYKLIALKDAIINIHFPPDMQMLKKAQRRLKFEELFFIQLKIALEKKQRQNTISSFVFAQVGKLFNDFYQHHLDFELTNAQKRVMKEIRADLKSGKQMNRLLQGDVGSGKTIVALMSVLIAADNNYQSCIMAPTEILANQHYNTVKTLFEGMDIEVHLLTGSTKAAARKQIHEDLQSSKCKLIIGTHALIEDTVIFKNLGLVVIDEQHRFGVAQRAKMWQKSTRKAPHILVMTATPIPRTMAMTLYGDLDVSVIDELPPGRKSIKTYHYYESARIRLFAFMKEQIKKGRQIYVVYPLIFESEKMDLNDLMDGYESISRSFPLPDYAVSILHGKMKTDAKEWEMKRFIKGETDILVSTTVIEVGVDVSNATVMVIENAERFGLSQLHQLRGRVGRGAEQSYCILITKDKISAEAKKRISTMTATNDGFEIAEVDLSIRGPGDLQGTQQSGILELKIANILEDEKMLKAARKTAFDVIEKDTALETASNRRIKNKLQDLKKDSFNWSLIS